MAEELGFDEGGGEGGAVQGYQGGLPAGGEVVEPSCGKFLSRSSFSDDEDGTVDFRRIPEFLLECEKIRRLPKGVFLISSYGHAL